jgi:hypothetical protein
LASLLARTWAAVDGAGHAAAASPEGYEQGSPSLPASGGRCRPTPVAAGEVAEAMRSHGKWR